MQKNLILLSTLLIVPLFFTTMLLDSNNILAYKETSTSCPDGYKAGQNDFNSRGQVNSKTTEHTETYQNCYLDGWMNACLSIGTLQEDCSYQQDNQF